MNCPNATSPVNIKPSDKICDLKCKYGFDYPNTNLLITNRGDYLSLRTDPEQIASVVYNANKYNVQGIRIFNPSLHTYKGKQSDGEIIIIHKNITGTGDLLVTLPIKKVNYQNSSTELLDKIINASVKRTPSLGENTTLNIDNFSLNDLVPKSRPFYSYTGTLPYSPCNGQYDYVVFDTENSIPIYTETLDKFKKIITPSEIKTIETKELLYYNRLGASRIGSGDSDLYIECRPTGSSDKKEIFVKKKKMMNIKDIFASKIFQGLLGILIMILVMKLAHYVFNKISNIKRTDTNVKAPSGTNVKAPSGTNVKAPSGTKIKK